MLCEHKFVKNRDIHKDGELHMTENKTQINSEHKDRLFRFIFGSPERRVYDQWFSMNHKNRFGKNLIKIPTPQYVVFYNGIDQHEDREILKLSDAFMSEDKPDGYEWTAIMINVNEGHNKELLDNCKILQEYAAFINLVRKYIHIYGKKAGIDKAVDECIMNDILKDILVKNKSEVVGMCLTEYDEVEQREFDRE